MKHRWRIPSPPFQWRGYRFDCRIVPETTHHVAISSNVDMIGTTTHHDSESKLRARRPATSAQAATVETGSVPRDRSPAAVPRPMKTAIGTMHMISQPAIAPRSVSRSPRYMTRPRRPIQSPQSMRASTCARATLSKPGCARLCACSFRGRAAVSNERLKLRLRFGCRRLDRASSRHIRLKNLIEIQVHDAVLDPLAAEELQWRSPRPRPSRRRCRRRSVRRESASSCRTQPTPRGSR